MKKIYLEANHVNNEFLKNHGAKFDRINTKWYVFDDVPEELVNLIKKESDHRIDVRGFNPICPICDADMILLKNKNSNSEFWGCSNFRYTECPGLYDYDEGVEKIENRLEKVKERFSGSDKRQLEAIETKALIMENIENAKSIFNDEELVVYWLERPNVALGGASPKSIMKDLEGNLKVKELLNSISRRRSS